MTDMERDTTPEPTVTVSLSVPTGEPVEIDLDVHPDTFKAAMEEAEPNGLVIAEDRDGKRWFCAYQSIRNVKAHGDGWSWHLP